MLARNRRLRYLQRFLQRTDRQVTRAMREVTLSGYDTGREFSLQIAAYKERLGKFEACFEALYRADDRQWESLDADAEKLVRALNVSRDYFVAMALGRHHAYAVA